MHAEPSTHHNPLSKHRLEALQDGVYAIAITLLVLELRLPEHPEIHSAAELQQALWHLLPRFGSWLISFFVLAIFWVSSNFALGWVRQVSVGLIWINLLALMFASFLPFAAGLIGQHPTVLVSQAIYAGTMAGMGLIGLWQLRFLRLHPELCHRPMPDGVRKAALMRNGAVVLTALIALLIAVFVMPQLATAAFMLMPIFTRLSRRFERQA